MEQQNNYLPTSNVISFPTKRPQLITLLCIFGFIGIPIAFYINFLFGEFSIQKSGYFGVLFTSVVFVLDIVGLIGYWKMRKWGVYAFTAWLVINVLCDVLILHFFSYFGYIPPVIVLLIGLLYFKKMS